MSSGAGRADCGDAYNDGDAGGGGEGGTGGLLDFGLGHAPSSSSSLNHHQRPAKSYDPIDGSGGGEASVRGVQGGVKSKWELATLSADEKEHLKIIMAETTANRAAFDLRANGGGGGAGGSISNLIGGDSSTAAATSAAQPVGASLSANAAASTLTTKTTAVTAPAPIKRDLKADRRKLLRQKAAVRELALAEARRKDAEG